MKERAEERRQQEYVGVEPSGKKNLMHSHTSLTKLRASTPRSRRSDLWTLFGRRRTPSCAWNPRQRRFFTLGDACRGKLVYARKPSACRTPLPRVQTWCGPTSPVRTAPPRPHTFLTWQPKRQTSGPFPLIIRPSTCRTSRHYHPRGMNSSPPRAEKVSDRRAVGWSLTAQRLPSSEPSGGPMARSPAGWPGAASPWSRAPFNGSTARV